MEVAISVIASDEGLRRALLAHLRKWPGLNAGTEAVGVAVVIATPRDCSPQRCRQLVREGNRVVILAPIWREHERQLYEITGASDYVTMDVDLGRLSEVVTKAATSLAAGGDEGVRVGPYSPLIDSKPLVNQNL